MADIRTFISFDPSDSAKAAIETLLKDLRSIKADVKWESSGKLHVTIKFLGNVSEEKLPSVFQEVENAAHPFGIFETVFRTVGAFPSIRNPNVVWLGCDNEDGRLLKIKTAIDGRLKLLGFPVEERSFHPHLTLGRVRNRTGLHYLISMLEKCTFEPQSTTVGAIAVMKSILRPGGAEHSVLHTIQLQP